MLKIISKILLALVFWGIFGYVVLQIPYPDSLTQANFTQIIPFFAFLYFTLVFTFNILFKNILASFSLSLGLIFLLILKALDSINWVTGGLILVSVALLFSYFRKGQKHGRLNNSGFKNLTKQSKIPKLTKWRKHNSSSL